MLTAGMLSIAGGGRRREKLLLLVVPEFDEPNGSRRGAVSGAVGTLVGWIVTTGTRCAVGVGVLRGGGGSGGGGFAGMT